MSSSGAWNSDFAISRPLPGPEARSLPNISQRIVYRRLLQDRCNGTAANATPSIGRSNWKLPVSSITRMIPVIVSRTTAAKNAAIPTMASSCGSCELLRNQRPHSHPKKQPSLRTDGQHRRKICRPGCKRRKIQGPAQTAPRKPNPVPLITRCRSAPAASDDHSPMRKIAPTNPAKAPTIRERRANTTGLRGPCPFSMRRCGSSAIVNGIELPDGNLCFWPEDFTGG